MTPRHEDTAMDPCRCDYASKQMWLCFYADEDMFIAQMAMPSCRYGHGHVSPNDFGMPPC